MNYEDLEKDILYHCRFNKSSISEIYYFYDGVRFLTFVAAKGAGLEICLEPISKMLWSMSGMDFSNSARASSNQKRMLVK